MKTKLIVIPVLTFLSATFLSGCSSVPKKSEQCRTYAPISTNKILVNTDDRGVAVDGYDVVAYFTDKKPVVGNPNIRSTYKNATYLFASADHKLMFDKNPENYIPQFGGYCAYAASINKISPIDPGHWSIENGRLLLQHNDRAQGLWDQDIAGNLKRGDNNWPTLIEKNGKPLPILVNVDATGLAVAGYDVVAFFTEGKPVKGDPSISADYKSARYVFASAEHKSKFNSDPERYVPLYGGFCGYAAAINKVSIINVENFVIADGKLVLQHTAEAKRLWNENPTMSKTLADANWPGLSRASCED